MKQTIKVFDNMGNTLSAEGTPVIIPGYEQYDFLFCKHAHMKGYIVRELSTGLGVYPFHEFCRNKASTIEAAQRYLDRYHVGGRYADTLQAYLDRCNDGQPLNRPFIRKKTKIKQSTILGDNNE